MNLAFWNLFGDDYTKNCLSWKRHPEPILPPEGDGWKSRWTANPDVLEFNGKRFLYYRGNGTHHGREGVHDRLAGAEILSVGPGSLELRAFNDNQPLVDVGQPGDFDDKDALDPAAVLFQGKVWLYYSAVGSGPDSIGLATSEDGENFTKYGKIMTGRAPEVILKDGRVFLTYQLQDAKGNYQVQLASSEDGITFTPESPDPIFPRAVGSWDSLSLVTSRLSEENGVYYMVYGGSSYLADEPDFFGLARSTNLIDWEPHPGNPIFGCGQKGAPDGGAIWFPAVIETKDSFVMLYEGSRGKYSWDLSSAICMAWVGKG